MEKESIRKPDEKEQMPEDQKSSTLQHSAFYGLGHKQSKASLTYSSQVCNVYPQMLA